jgi:hypothetical protein
MFIKLREAHKAVIWSNETGLWGGLHEEGGVNFATPCLVYFRIHPPCQAAPLMECHISRPEGQEDTVCSEKKTGSLVSNEEAQQSLICRHA